MYVNSWLLTYLLTRSTTCFPEKRKNKKQNNNIYYSAASFSSFPSDSHSHSIHLQEKQSLAEEIYSYEEKMFFGLGRRTDAPTARTKLHFHLLACITSSHSHTHIYITFIHL